MRQQNFVVCESELTNFSAFDVESIMVINVFFSFIHISISSRDIRDQNFKLSVNARTVNVE